MALPVLAWRLSCCLPTLTAHVVTAVRGLQADPDAALFQLARDFLELVVWLPAEHELAGLEVGPFGRDSWRHGFSHFHVPSIRLPVGLLVLFLGQAFPFTLVIDDKNRRKFDSTPKHAQPENAMTITTDLSASWKLWAALVATVLFAIVVKL